MLINVKKFMNKNKTIIMVVVLAILIVLIGLVGITFKKLNDSDNFARVANRNLSQSSDHVGVDGCKNISVVCHAQEGSVYVDQPAHFHAHVSTGDSSHYDENKNCRKRQNFGYTWKDSSIGTKDGINLSVVVSTSGGSAKEAQCPNVKVLPKNNSAGDQTHQCGILFMRGPNFYMAARDRIMDQKFTYIDDNIYGVGPRYKSVVVRGLTPGNLAYNSDYAASNINFIESNLSYLSSKNAGLIAAFSISAIGSYNWLHALSPPGTYVPDDMFLYDPPYAVTSQPWAVCKPLLPGVLRTESQALGNGCNITYARVNGITSSITKNWTNGTTNPDTEHSRFISHPEELDDIPEWVEDNCPHIYFPGII